MKYDSIVNERDERLDEIWAGLKNWLGRFMQMNDMEVGTTEMQNYVTGWINQFMRLVARYKDDDGRPFVRQTIDHVPLSIIYLYLRRFMKLDDREINALLKNQNLHPLTVKAGMKTTPPIQVKDMRMGRADDGSQLTIGSWFDKHASPSALGNKPDMRFINAEKWLDELISMAATRRMELDQLGDDPVGKTRSAAAGAATQATGAAGQATAPGTTGLTPLTGSIQQQALQTAASQAATQAAAPFTNLATQLANIIKTGQIPKRPDNLPPLAPEDDSEDADTVAKRLLALDKTLEQIKQGQTSNAGL